MAASFDFSAFVLRVYLLLILFIYLFQLSGQYNKNDTIY